MKMPTEDSKETYHNQILTPKVVSALPMRTLMDVLRRPIAETVPGRFIFEQFVSEEEEKALVTFLDSCEPHWQSSNFNGPHRGKAWGVRMNLLNRTVAPPKHPMPKILSDLAERMRSLQPLISFFPSEANANDYHKALGQYLGPHVDDRQLSTGAIVTLSLLSSASMTFALDKQPTKSRHKKLLPARSLQVLTGPSRYNYSHAIARQDFHGDRRVSVTFRQSPLKA